MCTILLTTELPQLYEYIVEVEISTVDVEVLQQLKDILHNTSLPIRVSDSINITEVNITLTGMNSLINMIIMYCNHQVAFTMKNSSSCPSVTKCVTLVKAVSVPRHH